MSPKVRPKPRIIRDQMMRVLARAVPKIPQNAPKNDKAFAVRNTRETEESLANELTHHEMDLLC
jgi:hypothetical protein